MTLQRYQDREKFLVGCENTLKKEIQALAPNTSILRGWEGYDDRKRMMREIVRSDPQLFAYTRWPKKMKRLFDTIKTYKSMKKDGESSSIKERVAKMLFTKVSDWTAEERQLEDGEFVLMLKMLCTLPEVHEEPHLVRLSELQYDEFPYGEGDSWTAPADPGLQCTFLIKPDADTYEEQFFIRRLPEPLLYFIPKYDLAWKLFHFETIRSGIKSDITNDNWVKQKVTQFEAEQELEQSKRSS